MKRLTEKQFQSQVIQLARLYRWDIFHTYDSRRCVAGFPDLTLVRDGVLIFAELKVPPNTTTAAQKVWLERLGAVAGVRAVVWVPADWPRIEEELR